jgi:hypothetical protein
MQLIDRLDALLSAYDEGTVWVPAAGDDELAPLLAAVGDDELAPLLAAVGRLGPVRAAMPAADFASALQTRLLARAATLAGRDASTATADQAVPDAAFSARAASRPTPGAREVLADKVKRLPRVFWPAAAAAVVLVVGAGTLTAAAAAGPGSPLYGLHRWEQSVQAQLAASPADRVRLHLANARDALAALARAAAHHAGDPAYSDALATVQAEDQAAAVALADVPAGAEHDALAAQLADLSTTERQGLLAALPNLGWNDRLATTHALGALGAAVPQVTGVQTQQVADGHGHDWLITVTGIGFQPGAQLVANGRPLGQVVAVTADSLTVALTDGDLRRLADGGGVENPDGTAAALTQLTIPSGAPATPTPGDHGKGGGRGKDATPTPGL